MTVAPILRAAMMMALIGRFIVVPPILSFVYTTFLLGICGHFTTHLYNLILRATIFMQQKGGA